MMIWAVTAGYDPGYIPSFVNDDDPRPAREQLDQNYAAHGGGWRPFEGFTYDRESDTITYPGDPPFRAIAATTLRDETIILFQHEWVMILQKDGTYEIAHMD